MVGMGTTRLMFFVTRLADKYCQLYPRLKTNRKLGPNLRFQPIIYSGSAEAIQEHSFRPNISVDCILLPDADLHRDTGAASSGLSESMQMSSEAGRISLIVDGRMMELYYRVQSHMVSSSSSDEISLIGNADGATDESFLIF